MKTTTPRSLLLVPALAAALLTSTTAWAAPAQQAYVKASNTDPFDQFGWAVAVSGDTMVIGAWGEQSLAAGVNGAQSSNNGDIVGAAYVFVRSEGNWVQQAYLKASNPGNVDNFGFAVAISGDRIVVGAPNERSNATGVNGNQADNSLSYAGAAYIFGRQGTTWVQEAYLKASNTDAEDQFGRAVAISGDTVVIGAHVESGFSSGVNGAEGNNLLFYATGAAYVFVRDSETVSWSQQAYLKASNNDACCIDERKDIFGHSVAISGDTIVVGAAWEDSSAVGVNGDQNNNDTEDSGAAYVFVREGTTWTQQAYLKASNTGFGDGFGWAVAVSGDTIAVGAPFERGGATGVNGDDNDNVYGAGAAYIFVRQGTTWSQQAYLKSSKHFSLGPGSGVFDLFGYEIDLSGDTVVVSDQGETSDATGINGEMNNGKMIASGAAYVFVRHGTNWSTQAFLKASNTQASTEFGRAVAVSGETVVVGSHQESSAATGVNGDDIYECSETIQLNCAPISGAAYVFTGLGVGPKLSLQPDGNTGGFVRFKGVPDVRYRLQRATSLTGTWEEIATLTAPVSGQLEYHDVAMPPGQAFYRTVQP